jgi:TP901 family phage tail tape measure protein
VGFATVSVVPSAKGFGASLDRQTQGPLAASGRKGGSKFGSGFLGSVKPMLAQAGVMGGALGLGLIIKDAVGLEATFSQTMSTMAAVADVPKAQIASLSALAMKMGADTTFSASEAANAMLELAKGGLSAATIKTGALAGTMTLAAAGGTDLATAATIASNALNTFGLKGSDMAAVSAAIAGGANASSASVTSLGDGLAQVGAGATNAGLSIQETIAALSALDAAGTKGSDGGTSLKTMLMSLTPATKKARKEMSSLGLDFVDAKGSFVPLTSISEQLKTKLGGLSEATRAAALETMFGSDGTRAATALMKLGSAGIGEYIAKTKDMGAATRVAGSRMSGTAGALEAMRGSAETAKLALGQALAPTVTAGAKLLAQGFNSIGAKIKAAGPALEKFGAYAQGTMLPALKSFAGWLKKNAVWLKPIAVGVLAMVVAFKAYNLVMTLSRKATLAFAEAQVAVKLAMATNPIGLLVLALVGLSAGLIYAYKSSATFREVTEGALNGVAAVGRFMWNDVLKPVLQGLLFGFSAFANVVGTVLNALGHVPGFGWAKTAGSLLMSASDHTESWARNLAEIKSPPPVKVDVSVPDLASVQERINAAVPGFLYPIIAPDTSRVPAAGTAYKLAFPTITPRVNPALTAVEQSSLYKASFPGLVPPVKPVLSASEQHRLYITAFPALAPKVGPKLHELESVSSMFHGAFPALTPTVTPQLNMDGLTYAIHKFVPPTIKIPTSYNLPHTPGWYPGRGTTPGNNAKGTSNWRGGPTWVGEEGPEILDLPRGSAITPNHKIGDRLGGPGAGSVVGGNLVIQSRDTSTKDDLEEALFQLRRIKRGGVYA